ncbi:MAG: nucleotidyl transferase AbiEii/AbiGii toxin family protein, partial [Nitrosotalea sp.]
DMAVLLDTKKHELDFAVTDIKKETTIGNSKKFIVKYNGFNNYPNNVRIDLSLRESVQNKTSNLKVSHNYTELPSFSVPSMTIGEIMAEKVRAMIYSGAPRHLYDLNYLFGKGVLLDPQLVQIKIGLYGDKFSLEKFNESMLDMKKDWVQDLKTLLPQDPPSFDSVSTKVLKRVSKIMKT